jgi:hypothetical protein
MWYMEHDVAGRDESSAVHDVIVCYDSFNSLPTCRRTDRRQIAPDFPIPIFSEIWLKMLCYKALLNFSICHAK